MPEFDATIEYRDVKGCHDYKIGNDGSFWSRRPRNGKGQPAKEYRPLKPCPSGAYWGVPIWKDGKRRFRKVYHLVLEAFVGPCPVGMEACHNDGNRKNNRLNNLRWDTPGNNQKDRVKHGTIIQGERCHFSKLVRSDVIKIRQLLSQGASHTKIAAMYNVSRPTVTLIKQKKTWAWLE